MRTIIAGSRTCNHYDDLLRAIDCISWKPTLVLSGMARGVDKMGERWALENNIPIELYPANWELYGKSAGYMRNNEMANDANALLALWDWKSKGTKNMIDIAKGKGLVIFVYKVA